MKPCSREDSNLHGSPHTVLSRTRLPVPPRERRKRQVKSRITPEAQAAKVIAILFFSFTPTFSRAGFQLLCLAGLAERAQQIGII